MDPDIPVIGPPDSYHVSAAAGWLDLGNVAEAEVELAKVDSRWSRHLLVLELRWLVEIRRQLWDRAIATAQEEKEMFPNIPAGWLHEAYAIRRMEGGGLEAARVILESVVDRFSEEETIPFNLACYTCQLGRLSEARMWLQRAMRRGGGEAIRKLALGDSDLEPLWPELRSSPRTEL